MVAARTCARNRCERTSRQMLGRLVSAQGRQDVLEQAGLGQVPVPCDAEAVAVDPELGLLGILTLHQKRMTRPGDDVLERDLGPQIGGQTAHDGLSDPLIGDGGGGSATAMLPHPMSHPPTNRIDFSMEDRSGAQSVPTFRTTLDRASFRRQATRHCPRPARRLPLAGGNDPAYVAGTITTTNLHRLPRRGMRAASVSGRPARKVASGGGCHDFRNGRASRRAGARAGFG